MTDRELMQMALDALNTCGEDEWHTDDDFVVAQVYDDQKINEARIVLRARLARVDEPQNEWRGLTTAERKVMWMAADTKMEFAELIEAKLKEKNS